MAISINSFREQIGNINAGQVKIGDDNKLKKVNSGFFRRHFECLRSTLSPEENNRVREEFYNAIAADVASAGDGRKSAFLEGIRQRLGIQLQGDGVTSTGGLALDRAEIKSVIASLDAFKETIENHIASEILGRMHEVTVKYFGADPNADVTGEQLMRFFEGNIPEDKLPEGLPEGQVRVWNTERLNGDSRTVDLPVYVAGENTSDYFGRHLEPGTKFVSMYQSWCIEKKGDAEVCVKVGVPSPRGYVFAADDESRGVDEIYIPLEEVRTLPDDRERAIEAFNKYKELAGKLRAMQNGEYIDRTGSFNAVDYTQKLVNEFGGMGGTKALRRVRCARDQMKTMLQDETLRTYFSRELSDTLFTRFSDALGIEPNYSLGLKTLERLVARYEGTIMACAIDEEDFENVSQVDSVKFMARIIGDALKEKEVEKLLA